ncbi:N-acetylmuramoyl-L-alanine amidase family protein [Paenibacillus aestuarii]|uniref:N-acetylmuramoyl-L-alanine amidase n=1 Tax=Paenibacillus aestuarii TaxID=516965 RepID=A0ABW0K4M7_9BACL|nr:N-acetylmuramoyl-L-alanine amidase family protein [Paenibacillus aestuarii]
MKLRAKLPAIFLILIVFILTMPAYAFGAEAAKPAIKLFMNEKQLVVSEVAPTIVNGNTIVPVRIIAEEIGAKVGWDGATRKVTIAKGDMNLQLTIDSTTAIIKGKKQTMEVAPVIMNGNTMLPLRFVGEQLGIEFNWDAITSSVHMFKKDDSASVPVTATPDGEGDDKNEGTPPAVVPDQPAPGQSTSGQTATNQPPTTGTKPSVQASLITSIELTDKELIVKSKDGTLQPAVMKLSNPTRIVFDFPNMALDDSFQKMLVKNAGEMPSKHPLVQKVRFSNYSDSPATVRVILDLKDGGADYRVQPVKTPNQWNAVIEERRLTVVIDAGHGDQDPGALSITGRHEKDFTLSTAKKVQQLLSQDKRINVLMTRSDDTFIPLDDRVAFANNQQADLFLSIHGNSAKATISGTETYYYRPESLDFAKVVHKYVTAATGFPDRKVRVADYRVINKTTMPAVLVEVGYLSNANDEAAMYKDDFQSQVAASLVAAIKEYLNLK